MDDYDLQHHITMMRYVALLSACLVVKVTAYTTSSGATALTKQSRCCSFRTRPAGRAIWTPTTKRYITETPNEHIRERQLNSEKLVSRRDALTAGAALLTSFQLPSTTTTVNAVEITTTSISIDASWSAVDGLNSNNNFVAFDPSAYKAMKDDPTRTPLFEKSIIRLLGSDPESKTVLDLGTGPFALFAILAAQAGAGKLAIATTPLRRRSFDSYLPVVTFRWTTWSREEGATCPPL